VLPPVVRFGLGRRDVADGLQPAMVVEPRNPFKGDQLDRLAGLPGPAPVDDLDLLRPVDRFGQRVVGSALNRRSLLKIRGGSVLLQHELPVARQSSAVFAFRRRVPAGTANVMPDTGRGLAWCWRVIARCIHT
jgi:hypothetical protein